jgi:HTH-type transcriptional regulator, sugar sensing transcriptional regulator
MSIESQLHRLGITGKTFQFYMAALDLGEASINEVAERSGVRRTTGYDLAEKLEKEGLLTLRDVGTRRMVRVEDPIALLQQMEQRRKVAEDLLPHLRSMYNLAAGKPQIHFYEGVEGIKKVLWDTLTCTSGRLCGILSMDELMTIPGIEVMDQLIAERLQRGISLRVVRSREKDSEQIWPRSADERRDLRFAPEELLLSMTQYVYDNKVAIISSRKENYGVIIESREFADLQSMLFEMLWNAGTPA